MLPDDFLAQLKAVYPKRADHGWVAVERQIRKWVANGQDFAAMLAGAKAYAIQSMRDGTEARFIKMARTFFGPDMWWVEFAELATSQRAEHLKTRARQLGFAQISDELLQDLDALEAKLTGIAKQREEAQKAREQAARKPTEAMVAELAGRMRA